MILKYGPRNEEVENDLGILLDATGLSGNDFKAMEQEIADRNNSDALRDVVFSGHGKRTQK